MQKILKIFNFQNIREPTTHPQTPLSFHYNYLLGLVMLYMMFTILSGLTVYKLIVINGIIVPAGIIVTPFIYSISNLITEVYGYVVSRNMMWWFIFVSSIFTLFSYFLIHLPSPSSFENQASYSLIFGNMPIIFIAGIIGNIFGMTFNNYIVSKYKVVFQGKKYWIRSILSTVSGELTYNLIAYPIMFMGKVSIHTFLNILISVSIFKIIITGIAWPFECLLATLLKIKEGTNVLDRNIDYNIFRFKISKHSYYQPDLKIVKNN